MIKTFDIELREISTIKPYDNNPRINDGAVKAVAKSLKEFGFRQPIVVDSDGVIICGHTRYKAAMELGLSEVPVHVAGDLTAEQIKAYRIADNKTSELSQWDYEILPIELAELSDSGFDMDLLAFDENELVRLLDTEIKQGLTDPDEVPDQPQEPICKPGDIWQLGKHRLVCGDATIITDAEKLMGNAKADQKEFYAAADTGHISQNVYLYCASEGLATVVRGLVDRLMCKEAMKLRPDQKVILAQTVGYPK